MTSRERILSALNHKQPDRLPVDLGCHPSSGINVYAYINLRKYLGLEPRTIYMHDVVQQCVFPDDDILEMFGADAITLGRNFREDEGYWKGFSWPGGVDVKIPAFADVRYIGDDLWLYNSKGSPIGCRKSTSPYIEQTVWPRAGDMSTDFSNLEDQLHEVLWFEIGWPPFPLGFEGDDLKKRIDTAKSLRDETDKAVYTMFGGSTLDATQHVFRMDNALMHYALEPDLIRAFLENLLEIYMENLKLCLDSCGDYIDILGFSDDLGMQTGPQISPEMYRDLFKPFHIALWGFVKKYKPHIKIKLHCCGGVEPLIRDLIDAGVDAINPVQISAAGMDLAKLKREYGKDITFWGGGCDTQSVLPNASPQEVKDHVRRNIEVMFKDGGYVFQQVHNILHNIKPENIVAMYEAVREYQ